MTNEEAIKRIQHVIDNKLTELDLSGCDLPTLRPKDLVDEVGKYVNTLKLVNSKLNPATIPLIAKSFPLLTSLNISSNGLGYEGAREIATNLNGLTQLDISHNDIGDVGAREIAANLKGLTQLNISWNQIGYKGAREIADLNGLTELDINVNKIGYDGAREITAKLKNLTSLYISVNQIGSEGAREVATNLKELRQLDIDSNDIGDKGALEIAANLKSLVRLDIAGNRIGYEGAHEIAGKLKGLTRLYISSNNIGYEGAREIAANLKELTQLYIGSNQIGYEGAREIAGNLKGLTRLDISSNHIGDKGAREIAANLKGLRLLYIGYSQIGDVGACEIAGKLKGLTRLDISSNQIGDKGLRAIATASALRGTQIDITKNIPQSIPKDVANDIDALRDYFSTNLVLGKVLRIILCGNTLAGKTSLAGKLKHIDTENPDEKERTHGIRHWCITPEDSQRNVVLNIWDFGGQDYYHATHAASLSSGDRERDNQLTMYVLIWRQTKPPVHDEGKQQFDEDYWFGFIQLLAGKPDMTVLQTYTDVDNPAFPKATLKDNYFSLAPGSYQHVTLGKDKFAEKEGKHLWGHFTTHFYGEVERKLAESKEQIPEVWPKLRETAIPGIMKGNVVLTKEEFRKKLLASDVLKDDPKKDVDLAYDALLPYLRGCGDIMYWDVKEGELKDKVVVNIEQFHKEIYEELLTEDVRKHYSGKFTPDTKHDFHVSYLLYHELIFKKENEANIYVAPQYLPEQPLADHFRDLMPLTLVLKFPHYMPRYLITRLIVRAYNKDNSTHYWKYGCISKWTNAATTTKFMVAIDTELQTVSFYIQDTRDKYEVLKKLFKFFASFGVYDAWQDEKRVPVEDEKLLLREEKAENKLPEEITNALQISVDASRFVALGELKKAIKCGQPTVRDNEGNYTGIDIVMMQVADENAPKSPKRIFFSYSRYDRQYREEFDIHFAPMKRAGLVASWYDGEIEAGADANAAIMKELENADIVICLLSPRFMANDYIWGIEMVRAKDMGKTIIPITLKRCDYKKHFADHFEMDIQGFITQKQFDPEQFISNKTKKDDIIWIASEENEAKRDEYYGFIVSRIRKMIEQ